MDDELLKALNKAWYLNAHKYNYEHPQNKTCIYDKAECNEIDAFL